jgi:uncharacterized protein (TIGR02246 family)
VSAKTAQEVDQLFGEYLNAGNLDGLVGLYEPNATLIPQPGQVAVGSEAIGASLSELLAAAPRVQTNVVRSAGDGDVVMLYNDWSGTFAGPDGKPMEIAAKAIEVVRRQPDGTWRFVIDDPYARD